MVELPLRVEAPNSCAFRRVLYIYKMKSISSSPFLVLLSASLNSAKPITPRATTTAVSITLPTSYDSTDVIDVNFPAFAFEEASFVNYVLDADGNTNEFSVNLIDSLTSRTGGTP